MGYWISSVPSVLPVNHLEFIVWVNDLTQSLLNLILKDDVCELAELAILRSIKELMAFHELSQPHGLASLMWNVFELV